MAIKNDMQRLAGNVFHDDPLIAILVGFEIVNADEIRVLEIDANFDTAHLNAAIAAQQFEGDLFAAIRYGEINLAETTFADPALDRVTVERLLAGSIGELHRTLNELETDS